MGQRGRISRTNPNWGHDRSLEQNASIADSNPKRKRVEGGPPADALGYRAQRSNQGVELGNGCSPDRKRA